VDLQERRQLDAARQQVAKVKARARPWRYIFALILAIIAATVSAEARHAAGSEHVRHGTLLDALGRTWNLALAYGAAGAFFLLAAAVTLGLANQARGVLQESVGSAHAAVVRFAIVVVGGLVTIVITLQLLNIAITQLLVGGALTGVIVGIAAQQSLSNVFAGIVLLLARPFLVGDEVVVRSGALGGLIEGTVTEISITYVRLETANGPVHLPNSQVLAAAVGPAGAMPAPAAAGTAPAAAGQGAPPAPGTAPPGTAGTAPPEAPGTAPPPEVPGRQADPAALAAPQDQGSQAAQSDPGR
jgi:small-conductance mechanosensitive channel